MNSKELIESLKLKLNQLKSVTKINTHLKTIENKLNNNFSNDLCFALNLCKINEKSIYLIETETNSKIGKVFKCFWPKCQFNTTEINNLIRHKNIHLNKKLFVCECDKSFNASSSLNRHKLMHKNEKSLKCDFNGCDKRFRQKSDLKRHKTSIHLKIRYKCDFNECNKIFSRK